MFVEIQCLNEYSCCICRVVIPDSGRKSIRVLSFDILVAVLCKSNVLSVFVSRGITVIVFVFLSGFINSSYVNGVLSNREGGNCESKKENEMFHRLIKYTLPASSMPLKLTIKVVVLSLVCGNSRAGTFS